MTDFSHLDLPNIRASLIRLEETIIFSLLERAQFKQNLTIYNKGSIALPVKGFENKSFLEYLLFELESSFSKVRRYTSPDEFPFSDCEVLPSPILDPLNWPKLLKSHNVNANAKIMDAYLNKIVPHLCGQGDDQQYGSSAVADIACLQALSKRIHIGLFVAESKFQKEHVKFSQLIRAKDAAGIMELITDKVVEDRVVKRVLLKATTYGQDLGDEGKPVGVRSTIPPEYLAQWFREIIMPLTKEVEVQYLLEIPEEFLAAEN